MNQPFGFRTIYSLLIALAMSPLNSTHAQEGPDIEVIPMPVSINALMVTLIDHSAHYLWEYGYQAAERELTDEEWQLVEYYAVQLAASGPLITLGGTGDFDDAWSGNPDWIRFSNEMSEIATASLMAARGRNADMLKSSSDQLVTSCEGCHDAFKPDIPSEGIMHDPQYDHLHHLLVPED